MLFICMTFSQSKDGKMAKYDLVKCSVEWENICNRYFKNGKNALSEPEQTWFFLQTTMASIDNGGFSSLFYNSDADDYDDIYKSAIRLKNKVFIGLLDEARKLFSEEEIPKSMEKRNDIMGEWGDSEEKILSECDEKYYANSAIIEDELIAYLMENGVIEKIK